ncbi:MAG: TetR/AcrR family transcriptional regulator [Paludibacteraceae bacterium]
MESRILEAAKTLFFQNGFAATSTTDIARLAGCNQALVHYYFRTKEKLFAGIFMEQTGRALEVINASLQSDAPFEQQIRNCVSLYFDTLMENPNLPYFVMNELIHNPSRRAAILEIVQHNPQYLFTYQRFANLLQRETEKGCIVSIHPQDLLLHVASLTIFPFLSLPMYEDLFHPTAEEKLDYLSRRKEETIRLILQGIQVAHAADFPTENP